MVSRGNGILTALHLSLALHLNLSLTSSDCQHSFKLPQTRRIHSPKKECTAKWVPPCLTLKASRTLASILQAGGFPKMKGHKNIPPPALPKPHVSPPLSGKVVSCHPDSGWLLVALSGTIWQKRQLRAQAECHFAAWWNPGRKAWRRRFGCPDLYLQECHSPSPYL